MASLNSNPTERQYLIENRGLTDFVCNWIALQQEGWRDEINKSISIDEVIEILERKKEYYFLGYVAEAFNDAIATIAQFKTKE